MNATEKARAKPLLDEQDKRMAEQAVTPTIRGETSPPSQSMIAPRDRPHEFVPNPKFTIPFACTCMFCGEAFEASIHQVPVGAASDPRGAVERWLTEEEQEAYRDSLGTTAGAFLRPIIERLCRELTITTDAAELMRTDCIEARRRRDRAEQDAQEQRQRAEHFESHFEAAQNNCEEQRQRSEAMEKRLGPIDPGGGDKIDELESCIGNLRSSLATAQQEAEGHKKIKEAEKQILLDEVAAHTKTRASLATAQGNESRLREKAGSLMALLQKNVGDSADWPVEILTDDTAVGESIAKALTELDAALTSTEPAKSETKTGGAA